MDMGFIQHGVLGVSTGYVHWKQLQANQQRVS